MNRKPKIQYAISTRWEREQAEGAKKKCCTGKVDDCSTIFCCCAREVGSMQFICERSDGSPIVVAGPCWPFCSFVTVPLICGLSGLVAYFCIFNEDAAVPSWFGYIYCPLIGLTLISLFMVSCRDPGLVERVSSEEEGSGVYLWNEQVASYRPPDAMYCRECKALIMDYDHLCPWTGTGIGKKNMTFFKIFVVAVNLLCYSSIAIVAYVLLKPVGGDIDDDY